MISYIYSEAIIMDTILTDKRFAHITRDPKFKRIPKIGRKIKIDKRFQSMFKDKKFSIKYTIDKRGKRINQTSTENLRKYYELTSSEDEAAAPEASSKTKKARQKGILKRSNGEAENEGVVHQKDDSNEYISDQDNLISIKSKESTSVDINTDNSSDTTDLDSDLRENEKQLHIKSKDENLKLTDQVKERLQDLSVNYARGEGVLLTDSSSDEESSEYSGNVLYILSCNYSLIVTKLLHK